MSGEDENHSGQGGLDHGQLITTRLRACEACKTRKVRCDKLDPCSACRSSNIPCWTAPRPSQQKRQRAVVSAHFEDQLSKINEQLSHLQTSIDSLAKQRLELPSRVRPEITSPTLNRDSGPGKPNLTSVGTPNSPLSRTSLPSNEPPYLGESSFEVHSHETGQILDTALHNSPAARQGQDVSSSLQSLRALQRESIENGEVAFTSDLPMPSVQVALAALRLVDVLPKVLLLCSGIGDVKAFRETCQRYYFPIDGYSAADFIVTNGGFMCIMGLATVSQLESCGIDPVAATDIVQMCSNNVSATIAKLGIFLEPRIINIECLLFGVQTAIAESDHSKAWYLVSFAARLCINNGLNRHKDTAEDTNELNRKKICFWLTYSLDKTLALNFGRSPNFSDYDISVGYPQLPQDSSHDAVFLWFDLAKLQGRIYEKLYSAKSQQDGPEVRAREARHIALDFNTLRTRLLDIFAKMNEVERELFLDTEITLLANLTLVYRALPSQKPAHPLRFSGECISVARETLELHDALCGRLLSKSHHQVRLYIDWNLSICPFTPFIVILGTAILDANAADMHLLEQVVESLERASVVAPGAKKLLGICKVLLQGAKSCIEQTLRSDTRIYDQRPPTSTFAGNGIQPDMMPDVMDTDWSTIMPEDWASLQLDNPDNMSMLFDHYLAGNSGVMPIFEPDMTRFDTM